MLSRQQLANTIRMLSVDAVQKANSGHPGMPMGMADIAEVLWNDYLQHNPNNPNWTNRDRFVVSNGHGSMLLYSLLHLTGYEDMTMEQLKQFRQLHSKTPGHPEFGITAGVETTTGPLGQGISNAVGMALAERTLASEFNKPGLAIVDHHTYAFVGDGCLMEGISHESCSLAGHMGLGKLIVFWDDNGISIDGKTAGWFTDDTVKRFEAYNWHVIPEVDGHNSDMIKQAIFAAKAIADKPTLICCKTTIAYGSPNLADTSKAHGAPLGEDEVALVRKELNWPYEPFEVPSEIYSAWSAKEKGAELESKWQKLFATYQEKYPELANEFMRRLARELPANWDATADEYIENVYQQAEAIASRKASLNCLNAYGPILPELIGGSADLTGSNLTKWSDSKALSNECHDGNYIYYGVREFGMSAIMNGIALHGGFIPYGGTFLTFVDYARNAVRLAALMKQQVIFVYTHDSIGLGEDGPTHQPIEHISMLRLTPQLSVWRPCDAVETAIAWRLAIERKDEPTALLFSRQSLPHQHRDPEILNDIAKGGYILKDCQQTPDAIVIATGSEVHLAIEAAEQLQQKGINIRVVSMPSTDVFEQQSLDYKESVLPKHITKRIAVEAASSDFWYKYVGLEGVVIGVDRFGESAPAKEVFDYLGITSEHIVTTVTNLMNA